MNVFLKNILTALVAQLLKNLTPQFLKEVLDDAFDQVEDVHPLVKSFFEVLRDAVDIPDDIGGDPD